MSPKKIDTRPADSGYARGRQQVASKYLDVAELVADEAASGINVCVGIAVLAGIAANDAICAQSLGRRFSGQDHAMAAELLSEVDAELAKVFRGLIELKPKAHYGNALLGDGDRKRALRAARKLVESAAALLV